MRKEAQDMKQRELKLGEVLLTALDIVKQRFGSFLALTFLVQLPAAAVQQYQLSKVTVTEDLTQLAPQLLPVLVVTAVMSFLTLIGPLVTTVLVTNEMGEGERMSFSKAFYHGIRHWLAAALSLIVLMAGLVMFGLFAGMAAAILPALALMLIPLALLLSVYYSMMKNFSASAAVWRGLTAWRCQAYIRALLRERIWRVFGLYALAWLAGNLPAQLISLVAGELLMRISVEWVGTALSVLIQTGLGIFSLYVAAAGALLLMNYEKLRQKEWEDQQNITPTV